jgi:hypothetical protein
MRSARILMAEKAYCKDEEGSHSQTAVDRHPDLDGIPKAQNILVTATLDLCLRC